MLATSAETQQAASLLNYRCREGKSKPQAAFDLKMFERYTQKARRVVFSARYEASRYGSLIITTEHLLLAILQEDKEIFGILLADWQSVAQLEKAVRAQQERNAPRTKSTQVDLPLDDPAKRAVVYAAEEAERLSDRHIGAEHLLLGLLREPSPAAEILQANGIDLASTREKLRLDARRSIAPEITQPRASQLTASDVHVEFVEGASKALIAIVASPAMVPAIGEQVVFGSKFFRVVNVSQVYPEAAVLEGLSHITPRIRVSLELLAETG